MSTVSSIFRVIQGLVGIVDSSGNQVGINGDRLKVDVGAGGDTLNQYNEISSLASSATGTIIDYTIPASKEFTLKRIDVSGNSLGVYEVEINSSTESKKRTYFPNYNTDFEFKDLILVEGDNIKILVQNRSSSLGDFNANIQGSISNA